MHKHDLLMHKKWFRATSWVVLTVFLTASVYLVEQNATVLRTSLLPTATHQPFDGTTYPIKKVPDWSSLSTEEYNNVYSAIPSEKLIDIPRYTPSDFATPFSSLRWGDSSTKNLRNEKITYSVPYMGNYSLDATEYSGSHLAVDIKVPKGTPVFAIGNGIVVKVSNISSGFGNHIVIEHDNFPTIDGSGFTTYYSAYCHLDSILISEGDIVRKGDQIGLSGETGTATTPHLHFQIDNENAEWHPFWPFTWAEASAAGLSFFSAVNAGLGQDKAIMTTINPMGYVQKYLDLSNVPEMVESRPEVETTPEVPETENVSIETPTLVATETPILPVNLQFKIDSGDMYESGSTVYFTITVLDLNNNPYVGKFDGLVNLSLENNIGTLDKDRLSSEDFENGEAKLKLSGLVPGESKVRVSYGDEVFYSDSFKVIVVEEETVKDKNTSFSDIPESHENYEAITYLAQKGIINGYPDGTFKPDATVTRAEALKLILEGINATMEISEVPFKDVATADWAYKYISTAYLKSIVSGYPDGKFKAGNTVNKAEFFKILFTAMDANISKKVSEDPFKDVSKKDWFAPYFAYAKKHEIIDSGLRARPTSDMKRDQVAEAIYRVMTMED